MVVTGDGELGFDSEREPEKRLPHPRKGSRRANYPILTREVCTGLLVPSVGDALLALIGRGRASGAVTLKKLECSKQAYALTPLAPYEKSTFLGSGGEYGRKAENLKELTEGHHQEWSLRLNLTQHGETYQVCDALRCSGPHARYTDVFNEYIALADRPGKSLKFHRDGDRSLQLLVFNEEFLNPVNHRVFERKLRPKPSGPRARLPGRHASRRPNHAPLIGTHGIGGGDWSPVLMVRVLEIVGREANGGRRCVPVGCGTAIAGPPIDSGRGPVRIGAAAKARAVDRLVEMPSRRSWLAARAVSAIIPACSRHRPVGHPIRPVLKHGPRSQTCDGTAASLSRATESRAPSGAIFGKQNWRCGMNRKPGYGAKLRANLEPTKGVGRLRQAGRWSWKSKSAKECVTTPPAESTSPENGWRLSARPTPGRRGKCQAPMSRRARRSLQNLGREPGRSGRRCGSWW
ncbi:hypothetical protein L2E82_53600 [Cichorium intybus]|nr:hypothetical protein L2E82_53600 [Cichorium intybus]